MLWFAFGSWSSSNGALFVRQRVYWHGCKWTPLVRVFWRYCKGPGYPNVGRVEDDTSEVIFKPIQLNPERDLPRLA